MSGPTTWEFLLWDNDPGPPPLPVPRRLRLLAAVRTAQALRVLRRRGWQDAQRYLRELRPLPLAAGLRPSDAVRLARREAQPCLTVLRMAEPEALCLPRSYALATYLSVLGLPAEVVVARQRSSIGGRFAFHAWAELYGEVLADIPGVQSGFTVLQRVGCAHAVRAPEAEHGPGAVSGSGAEHGPGAVPG
ncbi:lasso peptide biosynthesis B2 protein [Streptomyces piniterrae]|uniref:lasso peptide biosynthesis B2 protein n=1 Tax=Streptomyces piniterrae TaxID=2571125 RepID=UPI00145F447F|nr:lasso peptide biosynthesis B2 protein [Streptomyces piniterrae]